jgi:hypothetical protein
MATYTWGVASSGGTDWLMQDCTEASEAQEGLALDSDGEPVAVHYYQKLNTFQFEAIVPSGATLPAVGSTFTFGGASYYITAASKVSSNTNYMRYNISGKRFTTADLPASGG